MKLPTFQSFSSASFVAGIIVGVLISGAWIAAGNGDFTSLRYAFNLSTSTPSRAEADTRGSVVSVADQAAGDSVFVSSVNAAVPVWVAVRELNGRDLGNVLGAVKVGAPRTNVSIPLLRGTVSGRTYAIELYRDDGEGDFDPARFSVYVDYDSGLRIVAYFNTIF